MELVKKSVLAVVIATTCAPAIASLTNTERATAIEQFQKGAAIFNVSAFTKLKAEQLQASGDGIRKAVANRIRTQPQVDALDQAHKDRFSQLKGDSLTADNQARTADQTIALNDAHADRFQQLKGEALTEANQARTSTQKDALDQSHKTRFTELKAEQLQASGDGIRKEVANRIRTQPQVDALDQAHKDRFSQLKGDSLTADNQARTAGQTIALNDARADRFQQLKGEALTEANQTRTADQKDALDQAHKDRFDQLKGDTLTANNLARVSTQAVDPQEARDNGQDLAIQDAHATASHAMAQAQENKTGLEDAHKAIEANGQHILAAGHAIQVNKDNITALNDRLDNLPTPKDGVDGKDGKDGVTTITTDNTLLTKETNDRVVADAAQEIKITDAQNSAGAAMVGVVTVAGQVSQETANRKAVDSVQDGKIAANIHALDQVEGHATVAEQAASAADAHAGIAETAAHTAQDAVKHETTARTQQFNVLSTGVNQAQATGEYAQSRADAAYAHTEANRVVLDNTNKRLAQNTADIADHEIRIETLEGQTNSKFGALRSEVDQNRKRASAGIAGVAAMANIPQVTEGATFSVGAGAGNTDGESALAIGFSARAAQNVVVKASVSNDTQHNFVVGTGASVQW